MTTPTSFTTYLHTRIAAINEDTHPRLKRLVHAIFHAFLSLCYRSTPVPSLEKRTITPFLPEDTSAVAQAILTDDPPAEWASYKEACQELATWCVRNNIETTELTWRDLTSEKVLGCTCSLCQKGEGLDDLVQKVSTIQQKLLALAQTPKEAPAPVPSTSPNPPSVPLPPPPPESPPPQEVPTRVEPPPLDADSPPSIVSDTKTSVRVAGTEGLFSDHPLSIEKKPGDLSRLTYNGLFGDVVKPEELSPEGHALQAGKTRVSRSCEFLTKTVAEEQPSLLSLQEVNYAVYLELKNTGLHTYTLSPLPVVQGKIPNSFVVLALHPSVASGATFLPSIGAKAVVARMADGHYEAAVHRGGVGEISAILRAVREDAFERSSPPFSVHITGDLNSNINGPTLIPYLEKVKEEAGATSVQVTPGGAHYHTNPEHRIPIDGFVHFTGMTPLPPQTFTPEASQQAVSNAVAYRHTTQEDVEALTILFDNKTGADFGACLKKLVDAIDTQVEFIRFCTALKAYSEQPPSNRLTHSLYSGLNNNEDKFKLLDPIILSLIDKFNELCRKEGNTLHVFEKLLKEGDRPVEVRKENMATGLFSALSVLWFGSSGIEKCYPGQRFKAVQDGAQRKLQIFLGDITALLDGQDFATSFPFRPETIEREQRNLAHSPFPLPQPLTPEEKAELAKSDEQAALPTMSCFVATHPEAEAFTVTLHPYEGSPKVMHWPQLSQ